jgi:hypothetical protein
MEKTAFIVFMHYSEENNKDDIHTAFLPVLHSKRRFISTSMTHVNDVVISSTFILMPTCTFVRISRAFYSLTPIQCVCTVQMFSVKTRQ